MNTALITVSELGNTQLAPTQDALTQRDKLLNWSRKGLVVNDTEAAQKATAVLRLLMDFIRSIELSRKEAKAPILELGKKVDALGVELVAEIKVEAERINALVSTFAAAEAERERQAKIKAREEEQRLLLEAQEKERAEMEERRVAQEKADAKAAELLAKSNRARSAAKKAEFEAAAAKVQKEAEAAAKASEERADAAVEVVIDKVAEQRLAVAEASRTKVAGTALNMKPKFEVEDIYALYEAAPTLVVLTPNKAAINAQLKTLPKGASLPGVKHWFEAKTTIR